MYATFLLAERFFVPIARGVKDRHNVCGGNGGDSNFVTARLLFVLRQRRRVGHVFVLTTRTYAVNRRPAYSHATRVALSLSQFISEMRCSRNETLETATTMLGVLRRDFCAARKSNACARLFPLYPAEHIHRNWLRLECF